jgi:hypothetical protein
VKGGKTGFTRTFEKRLLVGLKATVYTEDYFLLPKTGAPRLSQALYLEPGIVICN